MAHILILIVISLFCCEVYAKDLGTFGTSYEIQEENLQDYLKKRMMKLSKQEKAMLQQKILDNYLASKKPKEVEGLEKSRGHSVRYMDPSVQAKEEILDHEGHVIVRRGEIYNPLEGINLHESLLFLDGSDQKQLAWARELDRPTKWILVKGDPFELERLEGRPVYFDQGGTLVKHFKIRFVPTEVSQEGAQFKIEEVQP